MILAAVWLVIIPMAGRALDTLDRFLENVPFLRRMAWVFTFELQRRDEP